MIDPHARPGSFRPLPAGAFGAGPFAASGLPDPVAQAEFYADVPLKRGLAWMLDSVAVLALCLLLLPFTAFAGLFVWPVYWLVVGFFYRLASVAALSATPGMLLVSIRLHGHDGRRLTRGTALMHVLGYSVSVALVVPQLLSAAMMLTTPRRQGLTDMILGTAALNRAARG